LHARVALSLGRAEKEAILRLLAAADQLLKLDPSLAHATHLEALQTAFFFMHDSEIREAVVRALDEAGAPDSGAVQELIVRGWAQLLGQGYPAGTHTLREAMVMLRDKTQLDESELPLLLVMEGVTRSEWDLDSWETIARRAVRLARDSGALATLPEALGSWAEAKVATGEFAAAATALAEAEAIADVTRARPTPDWNSAWLDAFRSEEAEALARIAEVEHRAGGIVLARFDHARAVVYNSAGRYESALEPAQRSCDRHPLGTSSWGLVELVEAAARCGEHERASRALAQLRERTRLSSTEWALGLEARSAALATGDGSVAEPLYREAVERLRLARTRPDLARAHLVYGEWLRREGRRLDAREELRTAHDMFGAVGMPVFAARARRELAGTGETARDRKSVG